ncbi:hypothetical protein AB0442_27500 [Kitasatospora sp. NPDC085895]
MGGEVVGGCADVLRLQDAERAAVADDRRRARLRRGTLLWCTPWPSWLGR